MYPPEKQQPSVTTAPGWPTSARESIADLPHREPGTRKRSRFHPAALTWKAWAAIGVTVVIVVAATIIGVVLNARANAYPNYSQIQYRLQDTYAGDSFFDNFEYFTGFDPAHGFVHYVDGPGSMAQNLTRVSNTPSSVSSLSTGKTAILRVDTSDTNATTGRRSVRITSKKTYHKGLFIFDVLHSPFGCATWPALWLTDPNPAIWPANGEIDIMEGVNQADTGNQVTLHTAQGCKIGKNRKRIETGKALSYDCYNATNGNQGCAVQGPANSFGEAFNDMGGGVYAMELRSEGIRVWNFARSSIPADISSRTPDPSTWPKPLADFPNLECDIDTHFKNQSIVANIDLCGDFAGKPEVFGAGGKCPGTCSDWVAFKPESFQEAYWEFGGWWVYESA